MEKLLIWWGWMCYKHELLSVISALCSSLMIWCIPFVAATITKKTERLSDSTMTIFLGAAVASGVMVLLFTMHWEKVHRNWRVAVAEAEKLIKDLKEEIDIHASTILLIERIMAEAKERRSGKYLAKAINLIRERHKLNAQITILYNKQRMAIEERLKVEEKILTLDEVIAHL